MNRFEALERLTMILEYESRKMRDAKELADDKRQHKSKRANAQFRYEQIKLDCSAIAIAIMQFNEPENS